MKTKLSHIVLAASSLFIFSGCSSTWWATPSYGNDVYFDYGYPGPYYGPSVPPPPPPKPAPPKPAPPKPAPAPQGPNRPNNSQPPANNPGNSQPGFNPGGNQPGGGQPAGNQGHRPGSSGGGMGARTRH